MMFYKIFLFFILFSCSTANRINLDSGFLLKFNKKGKIFVINNKFRYIIDSGLNLSEYSDYFVNGNDVFITTRNKQLIKISLSDRKVDWIKNLSCIPFNNFVVGDGFIYFNCYNNGFYTLNYSNGNIENIIFSVNIKTVTDFRKPYLYKGKVVAFFNNKEFSIIENNKVIDTFFYNNSVEINNNVITIDGKRIIKL